jgi:hypothetical protein
MKKTTAFAPILAGLIPCMAAVCAAAGNNGSDRRGFNAGGIV